MSNVDDSFMIDLACVLAALAPGTTTIRVPETSDRSEILAAIEALGASVRCEPTQCKITGTGNGCLLAAEKAMTVTRGHRAALLMGLVAPYDMITLISAPANSPALDTICNALRRTGSQIDHADGQWTIHGPPFAVPVHSRLGSADSVVAAALLLAGLNTAGTTTVTVDDAAGLDAIVARFAAFGVTPDQRDADTGAIDLSVEGQCELKPAEDIWGSDIG